MSAGVDTAAGSSERVAIHPSSSFARSRLGRGRAHLRGMAFTLGLLLVLEVAMLILDSRFFPRPSAVAVAVIDQLLDGRLSTAVLGTVGSFVMAFAIASFAGVALGLLLGISQTAYGIVGSVLEFLRPLPAVSLIPFLILILGVGQSASVVAASYAALWPVLFNTYYGVRDVHPVAVDTARTFGLPRLDIARRVFLPLAVQRILPGIRVSSAIALVLVITVELLTASGGVGYFISFMQGAMRIPEMYAGVFVAGLLGYLIAALVSVAERRLLRWNRGEGANS